MISQFFNKFGTIKCHYQVKYSTHAVGDEPWQVHNVRLSSTLVPLHYDVWLFPDLGLDGGDGTTFQGKVTITVQNDEDRTDFYLHAKYLTVIYP